MATRGVTGDLAQRLGADQPVTLELTGQGAALAGLVDQGGQRGVDDDDVGAGRSEAVAGRAAPGADEAMISLKASQRRWSQGVSPSEGTERARASRQARVSAKDSAGSCTLMVRHASLKRR